MSDLPVGRFEEGLRKLINSVSAEKGSNTPDFILADYMLDCLLAFNRAVGAREKWYGRELPRPPYALPETKP